MALSEGFEPVADAEARVLILGSLPGVMSLEKQRYYAHPRNAFWPIMRELFAIDGDYRARCDGLRDARIALWDVLQASVRPGSLDADIELDSAVANDFETLLRRCTSIESILFNGKKAQALFRRLVSAAVWDGLEMQCLPSTSPAYAAMSYERKRQVWRESLLPLLSH